MIDSPTLVNVIAGGLSGITVDSILFPLDTIKTRLQARRRGITVPSTNKSFYKGLLSAMLGSFPSAATFWTVYEHSKSVLAPYQDSYGDVAYLFPAAAAAVAEVVVCGVRNPFEVVKQQMQAGLHSSTSEAVRTIMQRDGVRGLASSYAGYASTVLREIPFDAVEFALYERMKQMLISYRRRTSHEHRDLVLAENAALGSIAGGIAAAVTTPLDVVKTRLMTQTKVARSDRYLGWRDAMARIYREEGVQALFSGVRPRVLWISIGGAIFIGSFEEIRRRIKRDEPIVMGTEMH